MPTSRVRIAAALGGLLLSATGCDTGGGTESAAESGSGATKGARGPEPTQVAEIRPDPPVTVDCADRIATPAAPPAGHTVLLGDVALETGRRLQTSRTTGAASTHPLFAKSGLVVRGGTAVDLEVVPTPGHGAAIGWGNRDATAGAIRIPSCTSGTSDTNGTGESTWVAFAGGFHVDRPGCVTLIVRSRGLQTRAHVPVGADC